MNITKFESLVLIGLAISLAVCSTPAPSPDPGAQVLTLNAGWQFRWEGTAEWSPTSRTVILSNPGKQHILWLRVRLPSERIEEPVMFVPRAYLHVEVFLGERVIYRSGSFERASGDRFRGFVSHEFPLPEDYAGRFLVFHLYSDYPAINGIEPPVVLGPRASLSSFLVRAEIGQFLVGFLAILVGLFALAAYLDREQRGSYAALSFGLFAVSIGLTFLARSPHLGGALGPPALWYYALFPSFILFPAAILAFVDQVFGPGYKRFIRRLWQFHLAFAAVAVVLDVTGVMIFPLWGGFLRLFWILDSSIVIAVGVHSARKGLVEARVMMAGLGIFGLFALHDIFGAPLGTWLMPAGTFIFILFMGYILYRRFTENSRRLQEYSQELEEKSRSLEQAKTELEEHSRTLEQKVLERTREVREKQAQLVQSSKMAALGSLVAGVAHEINTPVGAITSMHDTLVRAVDRLKDRIEGCLENDEPARSTVLASFHAVDDANKVISSGTERVIEIVKRMRSFARLDEAELKDADINEGLEDTLTIIHHEIKHNITVHKEYGEIPKISCYPGRLNQVFLNLLINAKQAIKGNGEIFLTTSQVGDRIHIEIKDTGEGIREEHLPKIFDPGFTTKGVGVGTGLGLSICYQIIQDHLGEINVESEPGRGSTFTVILPMDLEKQLENP